MEYVDISNLHDLTNAIKERNAIERERLRFDKEVFEFNKQINLDIAKANTDMAKTNDMMVNKLNDLNGHIKTLMENDVYLKKEIDALNFSVRNLQ